MKIEEVYNAQANFIYNDYSTLYPQGINIWLRASENGTAWELPAHLDGEKASVGTWLEEIPADVFCGLCTYIFKRYGEIKRISFQNYPVDPTKLHLCAYTQKNHWRVDLPQTEQELDDRLSAKKRYNIKRQKRIAAEGICEYEIKDFTVDSAPRDIIETYFSFKRETYGINYGMTPDEYLHEYHVSNVYALRFGELIGAILFSCEQGKNVYLENLTYHPQFSKYSLGAILYDEFLKILISKGKKSLYLGYGRHQYKSLYGAIEQQVFTGTIYRNGWLYFWEVFWPKVRRKVRSGLRRIAGMLGILHVRSILKHSKNNESENQGEIK